MTISISSVFTVSLFISLIIILILPCFNNTNVVLFFGPNKLIAFSIVLILRAVFPVEFNHTQNINSETIYPYFNSLFHIDCLPGKSVIYLWQLLLGLWIIGIFAGISMSMVKYHRLTRLLPLLREVEDPYILEYWNRMVRNTPKLNKIKLVTMPKAYSPFLTGIKRPVIVLPSVTFSHDEVRYILEHEALHFRNKDIIIKVLTDILCLLYWWNPLMYALRDTIFKMIEIKNDLCLTNTLSVRDKKGYLMSILSIAEKISYQNHICIVEFCKNSYHELQIRFNCILTYKNPKSAKISTIFFIVFSFLTIWISTLGIIEPYKVPEGDFIQLNSDNSYIIQEGDQYKIYYKGNYFYTEDSIKYLPDNIKIIQK